MEVAKTHLPTVKTVLLWLYSTASKLSHEHSMRERPLTMASRTQLFGARAERLPEKSFGATNRAGGAGESTMRNALEEDNDRMVAELEKKVSVLKNASLAIHDEVRDHNTILNTMGEDFGRTGNLMAGTLQKLEGLVRIAGGSSHMCSLITFIVVVFLVLWYITSKR